MGRGRPKSTKGGLLLLRRGRNHAFELFGTAARRAAWQCRHCQRECSALKSVKGFICIRSAFHAFHLRLQVAGLHGYNKRKPCMAFALRARASDWRTATKRIKGASLLRRCEGTLLLFFGLVRLPRQVSAAPLKASKDCASGEKPFHAFHLHLVQVSGLRRLCLRHESRIRRFAPVAQGELTL